LQARMPNGYSPYNSSPILMIVQVPLSSLGHSLSAKGVRFALRLKFKIINSKFRHYYPTDESGGLNNEANAFFYRPS